MPHRKPGSMLGVNGMFSVPAMETIRQTSDRLDDGTKLNWPGSVSIHGHMRASRGQLRRHERENTSRDRSDDRGRSRMIRPPSVISERYIEEARLYAAADKSDPFVLNRAMAHLRNGIALGAQEGKPCHYSAQVSTETITLEDGVLFSDGSNTFRRTVFKNVQRP